MFDMRVHCSSPNNSEHTSAYCFSDDTEYVIWFLVRKHSVIIDASLHTVLPDGSIESSDPDDDYYQEYRYY